MRDQISGVKREQQNETQSDQRADRLGGVLAVGMAAVAAAAPLVLGEEPEHPSIHGSMHWSDEASSATSRARTRRNAQDHRIGN